MIVSALAAGVGAYFLASKADLAEDANRLAGLESQAERENTALDAEAKRESAEVASLDKRVSALEASASAPGAAELDKRVSALEAANSENAQSVAAAAETAQRLATQVADVKTGVDASRADIPSLSARVAKLETGSPATESAGPDLTALAARVDKIEAALAAPKSETRATPEQPTPADNAAAIAIIAEAAEERLRAGRRLDPNSQPCSISASLPRRWRRCKRWRMAPLPIARWRRRSALLRRTYWPRRLRQRMAA